MKPYLTFLLAIFILFSGYASDNLSNKLDPPNSVKILDKDFPLFKDLDFNVMYLDFELLTTNIKSLRIVKSDGTIVVQDDVSDRSVDGIYEIEYSTFKTGKYRLELFSFAGSILHSDFVIEK